MGGTRDLLPPELESLPLPVSHDLVPEDANPLDAMEAEGVDDVGEDELMELHRKVREGGHFCACAT